MLITKIECTPIRFPVMHFCQGETAVQKVWRMGYGTLPKSLPVVIVQVHTDEGLIGLGDAGAVTHLSYMPETPAGIIEAITDYFAPTILGEDPFKIDKIMSTLDKMRGNYLAKAAIDFALHDIVGKAFKAPLYQLIGGLTVEKIPLCWVLSAGKGEAVVQEAVGAIKTGYHGVKIKTAYEPPEVDIETIKAIRSAIGGDAKICIDANAAWNIRQAKHVLKEVEKCDILYAEQPVPYWDIESLITLRRTVNIPIVPDESCYGYAEILHLIKLGAADGLFLKIPKAGGIWKAKMWAALAKAAGIPLIVGEKLGGGIQIAAAVHFACSTAWVTSAWSEHQMGPGMGTIHGAFELGPEIKDDVVTEVPRMQGGYIYPPSGPGLGVELNTEIIEKYRSGPTVVKTKGD